MTKQYEYNQLMDVKFQHQELIDISSIVDECNDRWFNQTLTRINDSVARIGIVEGEYHWHTHEDEGEFFAPYGAAQHLVGKMKKFRADRIAIMTGL